MFRIRPSRAWMSPADPGSPPIKNGLDAAQRSKFGSLLSLFFGGTRRGQQPVRGRRAADSLGRNNHIHAPLSWQGLMLGHQHPQIRLSPNEWLSQQDSAQMMELHDGADGMVNSLAQTDVQLSALQSQAQATPDTHLDLQLTTQQAFARIDTDMQRWHIRADEIERSYAATQPQPSLFASSANFARALWHRLTHMGQPPRLSHIRDQRRAAIRQDLQRMGAPTARLRQQELQMRATIQTQKSMGLRDRINRMAAPSGLALSYLKSSKLNQLHGKVDQLANELHQHREQANNKSHNRLDKRQKPRVTSGLPPPTLKPRRKDEKV